MPSSPKILKETILETALKMLIRDGYSAINIKSVAKELGCSTQPISRQFGSMEGFRAELRKEAFRYAAEKILPEGRNPVEALEKVGEGYINLAFDEPNLARFLTMEAMEYPSGEKFLSVLNRDSTSELVCKVAEEMGISVEDAREFTQAVVIYTHGLAMLTISGSLQEDRETVHKMVRDSGLRHMIFLGVPPEKAYGFFGMKPPASITVSNNAN